jgi:hypothetical protein
MADSQGQVLERILDRLRSRKEADQIAAMQELAGLRYSSQAIELELENLVIKGTAPVRQAALDALDSETSQFVRSRTLKHLNLDGRRAILGEIHDWRARGLISAEAAEVLTRRYQLERKPVAAATPQPVGTSKPAPAQPAVRMPARAAASAAPAPAHPATPRLTLSERLLSQATINIALYLGAFLVIGAALILAALVAVTRLPILLGVTALFGGGALAIKKRLAQPSFTLFVVCSVLLLITANVLAQTLHVVGTISAAYWTLAFLIMTLVWGFSTRFYSSRLFSLAAFASFALACFQFGRIFDISSEWKLFSMVVAALVGLLGVHVLAGWKARKFALPVFLAAQLVAGVTLTTSLGYVTVAKFGGDPATIITAGAALTWVGAAAFYAWSGLLFAFPPFAWAAVLCLAQVSWLVLEALHVSSDLQIAGLWVWGTLFCFASELLARRPSPKPGGYYAPFQLATLPLFMIAAAWAFLDNAQNGVPMTIAFGVLLGAGIIYAILTALRPREYVWLAALLFGLAAYFIYFALPTMKLANVDAGYQMLGASLLLLIPELFFRGDLKAGEAWRPPLLGLGLLVTAGAVAWVLLISESPVDARALIMTAYALLFASYALHFRRPWIGYVATACAAAGLAFALHGLSLDQRLAATAGLSAAYFVGGFLLRADKTRAWGNMLRLSGLALGAIVSFTLLWRLSDLQLVPTSAAGWAALVVGLLFFAETWIRSEDRMEGSGPAFGSLAVYLLLHQYHVTHLPYHLLALSILWLGADFAFSRTLKKRRLASATRLIGALLAFSNLPALLSYGYAEGHAGQAAVIFAVYALLFAAYAWLYGRPLIGYASTAALAFTMLLTLEHFHRDLWLPMLAGLSVLYFAGGYLLRSAKGAGWASMLRISGLALGAGVSVAALVLFKETGAWYVLVIGFLFAAEMYLRREDRMEFSAPLLLSAAAVLALHDLHVNEIEYHLLVISLIWLGADALYSRTLRIRRAALVTRMIGGVLAAGNAMWLIFARAAPQLAAICFAAYTAFFVVYTWIYARPSLGYLATASLPLAAFFELKTLHQSNWLYVIAAIAVVYYAAGFVLRRDGRATGWDQMLLMSGLGLGVVNSISALLHVGLEAAIPVAVAATVFAAEAFARRNVWLALPANLLYLESYFLILMWLKVDQPQFFSIGAALLGILMHYLLTRAGSKTGALLAGSFSQLVLLGTTQIQLLSTQNLGFFILIFFQGLAVLAYGIVVRSRSLVGAPILFIVLAVLTVIYGALAGITTVVLIGCSGIVLLLLGIAAVLLRERIAQVRERLSEWQA